MLLSRQKSSGKRRTHPLLLLSVIWEGESQDSGQVLISVPLKRGMLSLWRGLLTPHSSGSAPTSMFCHHWHFCHDLIKLTERRKQKLFLNFLPVASFPLKSLLLDTLDAGKREGTREGTPSGKPGIEGRDDLISIPKIPWIPVGSNDFLT